MQPGGTLVDITLGNQGDVRSGWERSGGPPLTLVVVSVQPGGTLVDITLGNQGDVALNDFGHWDVVIQYTGSDNSYHIKRLPYTGGALGNNQWTVTGIFLDAQTSDPEIFEPGILNPDEEAVLQIKLSPAVKAGSTNQVSVVTPNGIVAQIIFTG